LVEWEVVFDDLLCEGFGGYGLGVLDVEGVGECVLVCVGGDWCDLVDYAVWECDGLVDLVFECGVDEFGEFDDGLVCYVFVVL